MTKKEVGYGKPPKSGQFKKGKSGNPKGRPKGSKSLKTIVQKELSEKLEIKLKGKPRKVSKLEALVKKLMNDALSGNAKSQTEILRLANMFASDSEPAEAHELPASEEDQALIEAFVKRMKNQGKTGGSDDA